jgi:hypothetical protein
MAIELASGFEIIYCSDTNYEEMTVEILYHNQQVIQINKDRGAGLMEVSLYNQYVFQEIKIDLTFDLNDFLEAIRKAVEMLEASNEVIYISTANDFRTEYVSTIDNEDEIIDITYKKTKIAQIINDSKLGKMNLHILTECVKLELLSETKFLLNDFIEVLRQAKIFFDKFR